MIILPVLPIFFGAHYLSFVFLLAFVFSLFFLLFRRFGK